MAERGYIFESASSGESVCAERVSMVETIVSFRGTV